MIKSLSEYSSIELAEIHKKINELTGVEWQYNKGTMTFELESSDRASFGQGGKYIKMFRHVVPIDTVDITGHHHEINRCDAEKLLALGNKSELKKGM